MASKLILFHLLTAVIAINLIFAQDNGNSSDSNSPFGGFFGNLFPGGVPQFPGFRQERSAESEENESDESEHENRLFWARRVSCNYTTQGGTSCSSCRSALACYPNNVGRLRTCRGLLRYCNNGRCSFIPGTLCTNSTST